MVEVYKINVKNLRKEINKLHIGDKVLLTGNVYTSRDAAHKRYFELIKKGEELPIPIKDSVIYYAGPTPAPEGKVIGSCGPTTSSRMDSYAPTLLSMGMCAMIGKGERNSEVIEALKGNKAVYLCAIGGAGALASACVKSCDVVAFEDLGCESVKKLYFEDFPLTVAIDSYGRNIFKEQREKYQVD